MLGYPVVHTRVPDDVMIDEQWIAKSLDCLELRRVYTYLDKGQPTGAQDALAATSVTLGEPDPALFALPANPVEVTPLTLANQVDPEAANSFLNLDKIYPAHKAMREALGLEPRRYAVPASPEVNKPRQ